MVANFEKTHFMVWLMLFWVVTGDAACGWRVLLLLGIFWCFGNLSFNYILCREN